MSHWVILFVAICTLGVRARAQTPRLEPTDTVAVERLASTLTGRLLDGIPMDSVRMHRARKIVLKALYSQLRVTQETPNATFTYFQLQHKRDLAVRALVVNRKAREQFDRNAAALITAWAPVVR